MRCSWIPPQTSAPLVNDLFPADADVVADKTEHEDLPRSYRPAMPQTDVGNNSRFADHPARRDNPRQRQRRKTAPRLRRAKPMLQDQIQRPAVRGVPMLQTIAFPLPAAANKYHPRQFAQPNPPRPR